MLYFVQNANFHGAYITNFIDVFRPFQLMIYNKAQQVKFVYTFDV